MPKTDRHSAISLLTIAETAARLGCSDMHVYRLIESGALEAVDIAQPGARRSKTRVRSDHVDAFIKRKTRRAPKGQGRADRQERDPALSAGTAA